MFDVAKPGSILRGKRVGVATGPEAANLLSHYWAKADTTVAVHPGHHTIVGHSLDVAACAFVLLEGNPVLRRRLAMRLGLDEATLALTIAAIVVVHDIGKIDTRFQLKASALAEHLRPGSPSVQWGPYDHGVEGFRQIEDEAPELLDLLGVQGHALLRAVCGHHGALPTNDEPDPSRVRLPRKFRAEDRLARHLFFERLTGFFIGLGASLPWQAPVDGPLLQQLAGLCAVADWLGSGTDYFPYSTGPVDEGTYWPLALERAHKACTDSGLIRAAATHVTFQSLFPGFSPRDVQELTERLTPSESSLIIVEAAMGQGKTEAALALAGRALGAGLGDGLTIGLPTMATSNAMFARVESFVPRLYPGANVQLALAHGRAGRQSRFQRLIQHRLTARDVDAPEASVSCARWLLGRKRILLAQVGVGTIDQALQAALVVRHQFVRMFSLSRNVLILDEIHAYDAYMEVLLEHLLRWLGALNVTVVLLSATLPSERRRALIDAWQQAETPSSTEPFAQARAANYPLVTVATAHGTEVHCFTNGPETTARVRIERVVAPGNDDGHLQLVAERLVDAARKGARVVWIRNTVREAQRAFRAVLEASQEVEASLFHARFRGIDRSRIEQSVLDRFGKGCAAGGRVLVATQVVEQSLDLDFDELHSDLAPIDLLLQRVGRLHRHKRTRPDGFKEPRLVVHSPPDDDVAALRFGPSKYVYDAATLWLAHRALQANASWSLPEDIRGLVEDSYHPESRARLLGLGGEALIGFEATRALELEARRTRARHACIPPSQMDVDGGAVLDDDEQTAQAFTRDGVSATLLPVLWNGHSAGPIDEGAEPWDLDSDRPDAWKVVGSLLDQTLSIPAQGTIVEGVLTTSQPDWDAWRKHFTRFSQDAGLGGRVVPLPFQLEDGALMGWLQMHGKRRRVVYSMTLGLQMLNAGDGEDTP